MNTSHIGWSGWLNLSSLVARSFVCGYCGAKTGTTHGYHHNSAVHKIYICTNCGLPTLFSASAQIPGPDASIQFTSLPEDINSVYREITSSIQNANYTSAILLSRKLLMHIAVEQGADTKNSFAEHVKYLAEKGFVPPNADKLLDFIRKAGNQKNHEIVLSNIEEAQKILKFIEAILQFAYELKAEFSEE